MKHEWKTMKNLFPETYFGTYFASTCEVPGSEVQTIQDWSGGSRFINGNTKENQGKAKNIEGKTKKKKGPLKTTKPLLKINKNNDLYGFISCHFVLFGMFLWF